MIVTAETFQRAIEFAAKAHRGQYRKGDGRPYITHPMSVMTRLRAAKQSTNQYLLGTCAVLHDVVEDCGIELDDIAHEFGYYVAAIVQELTLDKSKYETVGKTKYLSQELTRMSSYALAIKLCDRIDNLEDMHAMTTGFIERYLKETADIIDYVIANRKRLTPTHYTLIEQIDKILQSYGYDRLP